MRALNNITDIRVSAADSAVSRPFYTRAMVACSPCYTRDYSVERGRLVYAAMNLLSFSDLDYGNCLIVLWKPLLGVSAVTMNYTTRLQDLYKRDRLDASGS